MRLPQFTLFPGLRKKTGPAFSPYLPMREQCCLNCIPIHRESSLFYNLDTSKLSGSFCVQAWRSYPGCYLDSTNPFSGSQSSRKTSRQRDTTQTSGIDSPSLRLSSSPVELALLYSVPLPAFSAFCFMLYWKGAVSPKTLLGLLTELHVKRVWDAAQFCLTFNLLGGRLKVLDPHLSLVRFFPIPNRSRLWRVYSRALIPSGRFLMPTR